MITKIIIVFLLFAILLSLGWGFYYLSHDKGQSNRTLKALIVRIIITVILAALILIGALTGFVKFHPL